MHHEVNLRPESDLLTVVQFPSLFFQPCTMILPHLFSSGSVLFRRELFLVMFLGILLVAVSIPPSHPSHFDLWIVIRDHSMFVDHLSSRELSGRIRGLLSLARRILDEHGSLCPLRAILFERFPTLYPPP